MPNSNATLTRSGVLVIGANSIQSLLPASLISQVEALLQSHRVQEAAELADQQRRKLETKLAVAEDELEELNYVYQRIGFQCFSETLFEDAGLHFSMGNMDPRILISYFPELRGGLFKAGDEVPMFSGVAEHIPLDASVDDLIAANLVRNYSPHIAPNTRDAPATAELRQILKANAGQMLSDFLRKWRRANRREAARVVLATVDTVLAKLFARDEKTTDLYALIREKHAIVVEEVEGMFISTGQYNALCQLFQQRGMDEKLLDTWSKLVEGSWSDEDIPDPLGNMVTLLNKKKDRSLTQKWGLWLTARDPEQGIKLLTAREPGRRNTKTTATLEEDVALLQQIQESNPIAGAHFLGHLVLTRRSTDKNLHTQLAMLCVDHLEAALSDSSTSKLWRAKVASYASTPSNQSFLSYFAATTPNSEHKRARLKAALFLQGSNFYDLEKIRDRIKEHESILRLELAMVEGKLGNDREALSILVHGLHDAASAEVYCSFGGQVIPPRTAQMLGEEYDLRNWASLFVPHISKGHAESVPGQAAVDEDTKKKLVRMLLEVNMTLCCSDGAAERTTRMLDAQAMNLDVSDVIKLVPDDWRLNLMSSFLTRSLRRTLHAKHEGMIVKNVSMAQNLEVVDQTWEIVRQEGAIIEEAVDCSDDEGADEKVEKEPAEYPFPDVTRQGHIVNAMGEKAAMDPVDPVDHEMLDLR
ncbi:hypothetical protein PUNSTDRAFT_69089 [Punctularia strigosozonata HHB-11173 SS5]|uniref:uncharacterized protein n=1 Tax=Punctularia strigosozonata (strain HHB-11173) TaxID=741275 RepID=UPI0004416911|nr:uncharacterized protein PUNSTDRAFT_69089 [Punctularia strigosozonata HHB-11173 SS5]EIN08171.1 hypothetical protein PUNSTDRAFT_69089 [Punctularia strigosozonata HHB-11173 SS5]